MSGTQKNVSDFVQKQPFSATNVSQFAQPKNHHEQQCVLVCQGLNEPIKKKQHLHSDTEFVTQEQPCTLQQGYVLRDKLPGQVFSFSRLFRQEALLRKQNVFKLAQEALEF